MKKILFMSAGILLFIGCDKEEAVVPEELQQNLAPENFALISPATGAQTDILDIAFEWQSAIDPDGDAVTYDLYVYRENSSPVAIAKNLSETSYVLESRSSFSTSFNWYVVAKDGKTGGERQSAGRNFTTRNMQLQHTITDGSQYAFPRRFGYTGMYFNNTFYVINGFGGNTLGDVWYSASYGQRWYLESDLGGSDFERYAHTSVIFNNRMYVIGGYQNNQALNDVYASPNGSVWTEAVTPGPFTPRYEHSSVVFNNKIWVIGGYDDNLYMDDVMSWSGNTQDRWVLEADGPQTPFDGIRGHSSVVFDNKIWIIGGSDRNGYVNSVWVSEDGVNWAARRDLPRMTAYHKSVVFDDKIWVIGGLTDAGPSNIIYYYDMATGNWHTYQTPETIRALYNHAVVVVNDGGPDDGIYIFGSFDGTEYFNDVWKLY